MPVYELSIEALDDLVRRSIDRNEETPSRPRLQRQLDRAVRACYEAGELKLASMLLLCTVARIQLREDEVHQLMMQDAVDHRHIPPLGPAPGRNG